MFSMLSYTSQVEYLKQEEQKIKKRLNKVYEVHSDRNWTLESSEYYSEKTACDYPHCPRRTLNNGINNVYRVSNKQTGEQLNLGSECYFKLLFNTPNLTEEQKVKSKQLTNTIKKERRALEKNEKDFRKLTTELLKEIDSLSVKFAAMGISLDKNLEKALEKNTYSNILRTAKLLDNALSKYTVEQKKLAQLKERSSTNRLIQIDSRNSEFEAVPRNTRTLNAKERKAIYDPKDFALIVREIKTIAVGWNISNNRLLHLLNTNPTNTMLNHGFSAEYILDCMLDTLITPVGAVQVIRDKDQIYRVR